MTPETREQIGTLLQDGGRRRFGNAALLALQELPTAHLDSLAVMLSAVVDAYRLERSGHLAGARAAWVQDQANELTAIETLTAPPASETPQ